MTCRTVMVAGFCLVGLAALPAAAEGATYDPRIVGLDVTQGVQRFTTHTTPAFVGTRRTARYTGVTLMEGRKTVVKVYADFAQAVARQPGFQVRLIARETTSSGFVSLATLFPDVPPAPVGQGPDTVLLAQRTANSDGVFTFTLPPRATGKPDGDGDGRYENRRPFVLSLFAELIPTPDTAALQKCTAGPCAVNDKLQVDDVNFVSVCCPDILTVKATATDPRTGVRYTDPRAIRDRARPDAAHHARRPRDPGLPGDDRHHADPARRHRGVPERLHARGREPQPDPVLLHGFGGGARAEIRAQRFPLGDGRVRALVRTARRRPGSERARAGRRTRRRGR